MKATNIGDAFVEDYRVTEMTKGPCPVERQYSMILIMPTVIVKLTLEQEVRLYAWLLKRMEENVILDESRTARDGASSDQDTTQRHAEEPDRHVHGGHDVRSEDGGRDGCQGGMGM